MRGKLENLRQLHNQCTDWELREGKVYYDRQRVRLFGRIRNTHLTLSQVVGAFCALSPNNSEKSNYLALDAALGVASGRLPSTTKIISYPANQAKALAILRGQPVLEILGGRKVRAFYFNTLDSTDSRHVTIDGHMLGAWIGERRLLKRDSQIKGNKEYEQISDDFRSLAHCLRLPAPHLQATLWLTWKRVNNILYSPQTSFELEDCQKEVGTSAPSSVSLLSSPSVAGRSPRPERAPEGWDMQSTRAVPSAVAQIRESDSTPAPIARSLSAC